MSKSAQLELLESPKVIEKVKAKRKPARSR